ncbi:replicative DNA helicase domain protein [Orientia tsutsugamushi str. UT76]|nr:replicative DNA helicase domain protein [Orientia tsutsugamushi str. UT76]
MQEIKLKLRPNLLCLFRYLSAIILNYFNQFRKMSKEAIIEFIRFSKLSDLISNPHLHISPKLF